LRLAVFFRWGAAAGVAFLVAYPLSSWLAARSARRFVFHGQWELSIPLVPQWILFYFSLYALLALPPFFLDAPALRQWIKALLAGVIVASLCFVAFPAPAGFIRILPEEGCYRPLFQLMWRLDSPFNTLPSLHVSCAASTVLALLKPSGALLRGLLCLWLCLIMAATVLTHQHHVLDVASGGALALGLHAFFSMGGAGRTPPQRVR
jgi:hypothetical protein